MVNARYPLPKPTLRIYHRHQNVTGSAYFSANEITINNVPELEQIYKTIIHEFCHFIDKIYFRKDKKIPSHNKRFWALTKEFGCTYADCHRHTKAMQGVFY